MEKKHRKKIRLQTERMDKINNAFCYTRESTYDGVVLHCTMFVLKVTNIN